MDTDEASKNRKLKKALSSPEEVTQYEETELYAGDFLIGDLLTERKTTKDILTKNDDGGLHIWSQINRLLEMRELGFRINLLVEGKFSNIWENKTFNQKRMLQARVNGILNSIQFRHNISIVKRDSHEEVREWIKNIIKRVNNPSEESLKALRTHPRRHLSYEEKALYLLQGIKGIGPAKSKKIMEEWKNLAEFFDDYYRNTKEFEPKFEKIVGKKYAEEFYTTMSYYYKEEE